MEILKSLLIVVEIITAALLICVILVQKSKEQGMGLAFGAGMGEALFGAQAANVLTKITIVLAVVFLVCTTVLAMLYTSSGPRSVVAGMPDSVAVPAPVESSGVPPSDGVIPPAPTEMPEEAPAEEVPIADAVPVPSG